MTRIMIRLDQTEYEALRASAQRDLRGAKEQVRFILRSALLNVEKQNPLTSSNLAERTVSGFEKINP